MTMSVEELATGLLTRLAEVYGASSGVKVVLQPGQTTTQDWCWGGCGTAYVRLDSAFPSSIFPNPDGTPQSCAAPYAARFHVGIHRCIAGLDEAGNPPPPEEQAADALQLLEDAGLLRAAIVCADWFTPKETVMGGWQPMGPFGNCAGGYWTITYRTRSPWPIAASP